MSKSPLVLALAVLVTCIPCLLIPLAAALIAAGAFSGALGLLGIPWALALIVAVPASLALVVLRIRRRAQACCGVDVDRAQTSGRLTSKNAHTSEQA